MALDFLSGKFFQPEGKLLKFHKKVLPSLRCLETSRNPQEKRFFPEVILCHFPEAIYLHAGGIESHSIGFLHIRIRIFCKKASSRPDEYTILRGDVPGSYLDKPVVPSPAEPHWNYTCCMDDLFRQGIANPSQNFLTILF